MFAEKSCGDWVNDASRKKQMGFASFLTMRSVLTIIRRNDANFLNKALSILKLIRIKLQSDGRKEASHAR